MIDKDMRQSAANAEVSGFYKMLFRPGEGHVWAAADLDVLAGEAAVHFSGQCFERALEDGPSSAIYRLDLVGGELARVGPGRMFRSAADGSAAFVEADGEGGERLVVLDPAGSRIALIAVTMRIETLAWSPSGHELLILAADASADVAGAEGGYALRGEEHGAAWLPDVMSTDAADLWRRLYRWSRGLSNLTALTKPPLNVWEASWLGDHEILVVASDHHGEGSWYEASMRVVNARTGAQRIVYNPAEQVGLPVGAPDGRRWAVIEAFCSDRGIICGTALVGEGDDAARWICAASRLATFGGVRPIACFSRGCVGRKPLSGKSTWAAENWTNCGRPMCKPSEAGIRVLSPLATTRHLP